jgi:predicted amidophosphoribosyltransferase
VIDPEQISEEAEVVMAQSFNCPNCGAAVEYHGTGRTMACPYCGTTLAVPEEFWRELETAKTVDQWKKYVIIFLVITVVLPTCLGLFGMVLGIGGSIFAVILQFILQVFVR